MHTHTTRYPCMLDDALLRNRAAGSMYEESKTGTTKKDTETPSHPHVPHLSTTTTARVFSLFGSMLNQDASNADDQVNTSTNTFQNKLHLQIPRSVLTFMCSGAHFQKRCSKSTPYGDPVHCMVKPGPRPLSLRVMTLRGKEYSLCN